MITRKKAVGFSAAGLAALAVGGGLFAWTANNVTATGGIAAGESIVATGCTTAALTIAQNTPTWNGTTWVYGGATVSFDPADTACNNAVMTLSALDVGGNVLDSANATMAVTSTDVTNNNVNTAITLSGGGANVANTTDWTVTIVGP